MSGFVEKVWPFPGDSPIARVRKMALAYRHLAQQLEQELSRLRPEAGQPAPATDPVSDLDERFASWGEQWHLEREVNYGPDDYVKAKDGANLIQIGAGTIGRLRIRGRIPGVWVKGGNGVNGHYLYKVSDLYALSETLRSRTWQRAEKTDTVPANGRVDSE